MSLNDQVVYGGSLSNHVEPVCLPLTTLRLLFSATSQAIHVVKAQQGFSASAMNIVILMCHMFSKSIF